MIGQRRAPSLKAAAIRHLARREYSRAELQRKLGPAAPSEAELVALLDELESKQLLSDRRFAESFVASKGGRLGAGRIAREFAGKGIAADVAEAALAGLRRGEPEQAFAVWARRFGEPPADQREKARQFRFLMQRGFSPATIQAVFRQATQRAAGDVDG